MLYSTMLLAYLYIDINTDINFCDEVTGFLLITLLCRSCLCRQCCTVKIVVNYTLLQVLSAIWGFCIAFLLSIPEIISENFLGFQKFTGLKVIGLMSSFMASQKKKLLKSKKCNVKVAESVNPIEHDFYMK